MGVPSPGVGAWDRDRDRAGDCGVGFGEGVMVRGGGEEGVRVFFGGGCSVKRGRSGERSMGD